MSENINHYCSDCAKELREMKQKQDPAPTWNAAEVAIINAMWKYAEELGMTRKEAEERFAEYKKQIEQRAREPLIKAVLDWWDNHQYDTYSDGEEEYNTYNEEPEFVTIAKEQSAEVKR